MTAVWHVAYLVAIGYTVLTLAVAPITVAVWAAVRALRRRLRMRRACRAVVAGAEVMLARW